MALSPHEKRSLFRFLAIYLGAGLLVVAGFSWLIYRIEAESIRDHTLSTLRMKAMQIAASAVDAQMRGRPFKIPESIGCDYLLVGIDGKPKQRCMEEKVVLDKEFTIERGCAYYVDRSVRGHLGIQAVVVRDCTYGSHISAIARRVAWTALGVYLFWVLVGWYLGRLFLKPMREKIEAMDRFVKDSTHELNTPVTTMLLALQKIESETYRPVHLEALQMSGRLIARIYEDLTFMTLQEKRVQKEHVREMDVAKVVHESVSFFSILAERKDITVQVDTVPCLVEADPHHLALLVKNLLDNALKYTRNGGIVTLTLESSTLRIADTGIGIPREKLRAIFRRFHRENDVEGGFGIGLNIVQSICTMYGYGLHVTSEEGKGSTFTVRFSGRDVRAEKKGFTPSHSNPVDT